MYNYTIDVRLPLLFAFATTISCIFTRLSATSIPHPLLLFSPGFIIQTLGLFYFASFLK
jgi:hypothetical protein